MSINSVNETDVQDDARVVAFLSPDDEGRGNGLGMLMHNNAQSQALRAYFEPQGTRFIDLIPLSLLAEAESRISALEQEAVAETEIWARKCDALQSRLDAALALADEWHAEPRDNPDANHLHAGQLRSAALGGELGNEEVV